MGLHWNGCFNTYAMKAKSTKIESKIKISGSKSFLKSQLGLEPCYKSKQSPETRVTSRQEYKKGLKIFCLNYNSYHSNAVFQPMLQSQSIYIKSNITGCQNSRS
jgi:hypothetical protein